MSKKRALISVSDKSGLTDFAKFLEEKNYELISTGGTFKHLKDSGLNPIQIDVVEKYIENQEKHHKTKSFQDEFRAFLKKYKIEYNEEYVWD